MKSDKRKSSFPFAFGKKAEGGKTEAVSPAEGEGAASPDEKKKDNPFSKFRATIKVSSYAIMEIPVHC